MGLELSKYQFVTDEPGWGCLLSTVHFSSCMGSREFNVLCDDTSHTETHLADAIAEAVAEAVAEAARKPIVNAQGKQFQPGP